MPLNSKLLGLLKSPTDDGFEKGTAYPIRDGVVITAAHVIPNIKNYNDLENKNSYIKWADESRSGVQQVTFYCEEADVAVLSCTTPDNLDKVLFSKQAPNSDNDRWDSEGFAQSAESTNEDGDKVEHGIESAKGSYIKKVDDQEYQKLETTSHMNDESFWQGMSGAPIFKTGTDYLTGIFIEGSPIYKKEGETSQVFNGLLKAASIAHLLNNNDFVKAVYVNEEGPDYQQTHAEKLHELWQVTPTLKEHFPDCDALIKRFKTSQVDCIQELTKQLPKNDGSDAEETFSRLLALLLSQVEVPLCDKQKNHTYDLE